MDRESALAARWEAERPMYEAWGAFVSRQIEDGVSEVISPASVETFFKIPITYRTKNEPSLLAKAFHRKKAYSNPYDDIEDKVGVRVVVLFGDDIRTVENVVQSHDKWTAEKARDYESERFLRPYEFDYQSLHYVVRSKSAIRWNDIDITEGLSCEVQIRTLLQHAYSELTHDTIYKPNVAAEPDVKRAAAKSMALIEATGDYFTQVKAKLARAAAPGQKVAITLGRLYGELMGGPGEPSALNSMIVDHYRKWAKEDFDEDIARFVRSKGWLASRIAERSPTQLLYRQPGVLLVYWAIAQARTMAAKDSPLSDDELSLLYSDLGYRLPS